MARMPPPHARRADAARRRRAGRAATPAICERGTAFFAQRLAHGPGPRHAFYILPHKGYTFGPALRILHVKNMGKDLALEELRICP